MELPIRITFRDMSPSDAVEAYARKRAEKLDTFSDRVTGCHVAIEAPHRHQQAGRHFRVRVDLTVPGAELVIGRVQGDDTTNEDVYAAVDEAFDRVGRLLEEHVRRMRQDVKHHESQYRDARVKKLWTYEGYGFLETPEGDEVYFHKNSVLHHAWSKLAIGARVRFVEEVGEKGPQASTVMFVG